MTEVGTEAGLVSRHHLWICLGHVVPCLVAIKQLRSNLTTSRIVKDNQVVVRSDNREVISMPTTNPQAAITEIKVIQVAVVIPTEAEPFIRMRPIVTIPGI